MNLDQSWGGDIQHDAFSNILSIGYELETPNLSKLSLIGTDTFLNTDTVSKGLENLHKIDRSEDEPLYITHEGIGEELVQLNAYTTKSLNRKSKEKDNNIRFYVLNDIGDTALSVYLTKQCEFFAKENLEDQIETFKSANEDAAEDFEEHKEEYTQTMIRDYHYTAESAEEILAYASNHLWRDS